MTGLRSGLAELVGEVRIGRADDADGQAARLEDGQRLLQAGRPRESSTTSYPDRTSVKSCWVKSMTSSAPRARTLSMSLVWAVVATWAPRCFATWIDRRSESAGTGVDQNLLAGLDVGHVDQGLPRGERDEWHRCRFLERQRGRLEGDVVGVDGDLFGEGADAQVAWSGVDLVTDLEAADVGPDLGDHAGRGRGRG